MKLKRFMLAFATILMLIIISGCVSSYTPYAASVSFPAEKDYTILGRVEYEGLAGRASYHKLLEVAKTKYSQTDDVVNIIVDIKKTSSIFGKSDKFMMSGIAIDYSE